MFSFFSLQTGIKLCRTFSTTNQLKKKMKVALLGAAGGIGQAFALLLKINPLITELTLYDIVLAPGVGVDLSHVCTPTKIKGFMGPECLENCLKDSQVVVITAGTGRKPGMTRQDLFKINASIILDLSEAICKYCPEAYTCVVTNPVNAMVPITVETFKKHCAPTNHVFGVTTLDVVRSKTFISEFLQICPNSVNIPVIGGHSVTTIIPVFSQCTPPFNVSQCERDHFTKRIQDGGTEVLQVKKSTATLSMAYAGHHFVNSLIRALNGECGIVECSYIESNITELPYFATPLKLGTEGLSENCGLPKLNDYEKNLMKEAIQELKKNIQEGIDFVKNKK